MKSKSFEQQNAIFGAKQPQYSPLPAFMDEAEGTATFCFELDEKEREQIASTNEIYLTVLTHNKELQPIGSSLLNPFAEIKPRGAIALDRVVSEGETAIIVTAPTGIKYTAQCGGIGCTHPEAEGFVFSLGSFAQDFDQCALGCVYLHGMDREVKEEFASKFNQYVNDYVSANQTHFTMCFDFDNIDLLQEGWIPVVFVGYVDTGMLLAYIVRLFGSIVIHFQKQ